MSLDIFHFSPWLHLAYSWQSYHHWGFRSWTCVPLRTPDLNTCLVDLDFLIQSGLETPFLLNNLARDCLVTKSWSTALIPKGCLWWAVSCNRKPYGEQALITLSFKAVRPSQTGKYFRKGPLWSVYEHGILSAQISLWLDGIWAVFPTLKSKEETSFCQNYYLFQNILYSGKGGKRHLHCLFWKIFCSAPRLFLIFQIICGMNGLPDFSCKKKEKKEEKNNS